MNDEQISADTIQIPNSESSTPTEPAGDVISRHYFVPFQGKLRRIESDQLEECWTGKKQLNGCDGNLRMMSVVFDKTAGVAGCSFMLLTIADGRFTANSIAKAKDAAMTQALEKIHATGHIVPGYVEQTANWPDDWREQLSRELGIALNCVHDLGIGGPLLTSHTAHYSINKSACIQAESLRLTLGIQPIVVRKARSDYRGGVQFSVYSSLKPWDYDVEEFLLTVTGKIEAIPDRDEGGAVPAGELKLLIVKMAEAIKADVPISGVCDCHSADLEEVWSTLFEDNQFKEEFDLQSPNGDLLYLDDISLMPEYESTPLYYQAIETAIATFASRGLVVAYKAVFKNDAKHWRKLGFKEIPRSELLVRRMKPRRLRS
jgi:hypothetical protein